MAEWFAVPCRALAGIAIIARDNSHNRDFTTDCGSWRDDDGDVFAQQLVDKTW